MHDVLRYGTFPEPARCDVRSVVLDNHHCPEVAFWVLEKGDGNPSYVCDRCLHQSIRRLTSHDRMVTVGRLPPRRV